MKYVLLWLVLHLIAVGIGWACDTQGLITKPAWFWLLGWCGAAFPAFIVLIIADCERARYGRW